MADYVNNADFLAAIKEHKLKIKTAAEQGLQPPQLSNYIGECILKIATHLSYKHNFINYTYKDEMILDGIENCIHYVNNFDPEKGSNPFAYFTQIIYYAFIRRITKEKKQSYIKNEMIKNMSFDMFELQAHDEEGHYQNLYIEYMQTNQQFDDFIEKKKEKRKKKDVSNLGEFIEDIPEEDPEQ